MIAGNAGLRAWVVRDLCDAVVTRYPEHADAIPQELAVLLRDSGSLAWLPASLVLRLEEKLFERGGEELVLEVCRGASWGGNVDAVRGAVFTQALKLIRNRPERLFRWLPRLRRMTTRGLGVSRYEEAPGGCTLSLIGLPAAYRGEAYRVATRGSFLFVLQFIRLSGTVESEVRGEDLHFHVRWTLLPVESTTTSPRAQTAAPEGA